MGVLDEAIRDHLELKRRHGASEEEIARTEAEALGPARREPEEMELPPEGIVVSEEGGPPLLEEELEEGEWAPLAEEPEEFELPRRLGIEAEELPPEGEAEELPPYVEGEEVVVEPPAPRGSSRPSAAESFSAPGPAPAAEEGPTPVDSLTDDQPPPGDEVPLLEGEEPAGEEGLLAEEGPEDQLPAVEATEEEPLSEEGVEEEPLPEDEPPSLAGETVLEEDELEEDAPTRRDAGELDARAAPLPGGDPLSEEGEPPSPGAGEGAEARAAIQDTGPEAVEEESVGTAAVDVEDGGMEAERAELSGDSLQEPAGSVGERPSSLQEPAIASEEGAPELVYEGTGTVGTEGASEGERTFQSAGQSPGEAGVDTDAERLEAAGPDTVVYNVEAGLEEELSEEDLEAELAEGEDPEAGLEAEFAEEHALVGENELVERGLEPDLAEEDSEVGLHEEALAEEDLTVVEDEASDTLGHEDRPLRDDPSVTAQRMTVTDEPVEDRSSFVGAPDRRGSERKAAPDFDFDD
ncbi:MAG: hypothetical protein M3198_13620 [Actinomycetota bacterium]|nr:hypothetical protein [Actinomycetota bacterium]